MSLTVSELGPLLLVAAGVLYFLGILPVVQVLAGFAGAVITGSTGWVGRLSTAIIGWAQHVLGSVLGHVAGGAAVGAIGLTVVLGVIFLHDLSPKKQAGNRTVWIGVALGFAIAAGITGIPALNTLHADIISAASTALSL